MKENALNWSQTIDGIYAEARLSGWSDELADLMQAYTLIEPMFTGWCRASGRPFLCHLIGTASLMLQHGGTRDEVLAALAHAVIESGAYGRWGTRPRGEVRALVADVLPPGSLRHVEAYSVFDWRSFINAAEHDLPGSLQKVDQTVLKLRIVNEIDDSLDWPFLTDRRREEGMRESDLSVMAARACGWTTLANHMVSVRDIMSAVPRAEGIAREDYFVVPAGYELGIWMRAKRKLKSLLRPLGS
jgi:hypothetical protein